MALRTFQSVRRHAEKDAFQPVCDRKRGAMGPAIFREHAILHQRREAIHVLRGREFRGGLWLGGEVEKAGKALFGGKRMGAEEEALEAFEIGIAFDRREGRFSFGAGVVPFLRD